LILAYIPAKAHTIFNWQTTSTSGLKTCPHTYCPDEESLLPIVTFIVVSDKALATGIAQITDIERFSFNGGDVRYLLSPLDGYGHKIIFSQDGLSIVRFESTIEI